MNTAEELSGITVVEQVKNHVIGMIVQTEMKRGAALPSYRELAAELDVACTTVKIAMDELAQQGVVRRQRARGCYVNRALSRQGRPMKSVGVIHLASHAFLFSAPYLTQIMRGINGGSVPLDVHIYTMREHGFVTAAQLGEHEVDGVILLGMEDEGFIREFAGWGIPGVVVDHVTAGVPLDFVACDNEAGVIRAVQHVVGLGHRHIRYLGPDPNRIALVGLKARQPVQTFSSDDAERNGAVRRALAACPGVRWDEEVHRQSPYPKEAEAGLLAFLGRVVQEWLGAAERPTAFLTANDSGADRLIRAFAARGVSVPGDVSVCAVAKAAGGSGGITGPRFDFAGMGRKAVELLHKRCEEPATAADPNVYRIGFEWEEGSTCLGSIQCSAVALSGVEGAKAEH
jgi:DNA-binding LacI/PurR family transcriptional regulator